MASSPASSVSIMAPAEVKNFAHKDVISPVNNIDFTSRRIYLLSFAPLASFTSETELTSLVIMC